MAAKLRVGQKVRLPNGIEAFVRYIGETDFKEGEWVGLELSEPSGKNNGSVNGTVYFDCEENYGMFMRPLPTITVLEQTKPAAKPAVSKALNRPSSVSSRPSSVSSRPAPSSSAAPLLSRTRSSVAPSTSTRASITPASAGSAFGKRASTTNTTGPSARAAGTSTIAARNGGTSLVSPRPASPKKSTSTISSINRTSIVHRGGLRSPAQALSRSGSAVDRTLSPSKLTSSPQASRAPAAAGGTVSSAARSSIQSNKELDELKTKVQFLEKKLSEERDQLRKASGLEDKQSHYENVIQKLQSKCQSFHQDNGELKKEAKSLSERLEELESSQAEHESVLELATLDREMAEEKAESFKTELDAIRARIQELELENEILREENDELGQDMSPEERTSQGWLQMQRENERLRQALLRLRDLSREEAEALKEEIAVLEEDSKELPMFKDQYETAHARLLEIEVDNESLREQLDAALGAESMIEQLTEHNLSMGEQVDDLRKTVVHLQDLKELNDELEDNHVEHERQLQEVIDLRENTINEMVLHSTKQDEELIDREYTISRFRELVATMQSDLEDMRASKEISVLEAQSLENSSRAILDMNRQLQASAMGATIKAIDLELGKLQAEQAADELNILQLFVPEAMSNERDSISAYLRFKRVNFKARLLHGLVKQRISESSNSTGSSNTYALCDILDKLNWLSTTADRFVALFETSDLEDFSKLETTLNDVEPVERTLNACLEHLKHSELQNTVIAEGLERSIAVLRHLDESFAKSDVTAFAQEVLTRVLMIQSNLENTALILTAAKNDILHFAPPAQDEFDEDSILFTRNSEATLTGLRSAKVVATRLYNTLQDMKARQLSLEPDTLPEFEKCNERSSALLDYFQTLAQAINAVLHEGNMSEERNFQRVLETMQRTSAEYFESKQVDVFGPVLNNLRGLNDHLSELGNTASDLDKLIDFEKPPEPWILRSRELKDRKAVSVVAEDEIKRLKHDFQERATILKLRQQELDEAKMKIGLLDQRHKEANKKVNRVAELEKEVLAAADRERSFEKAMEKQIQNSQRFEEERDRWMRIAAENKIQAAADRKDGKSGTITERLVGTSSEMDALKATITALEDANSYLRRQCQRSRIEEIAAANSWLKAPLPSPESQLKVSAAKERAKYRAVLANIAKLPMTAQQLRIDDYTSTRSSHKQPDSNRNKVSARAQLIEQEASWLSAWRPLASEWKGLPTLPVTIASIE